jgi:hypothetical protein
MSIDGPAFRLSSIVHSSSAFDGICEEEKMPIYGKIQIPRRSNCNLRHELYAMRALKADSARHLSISKTYSFGIIYPVFWRFERRFANKGGSQQNPDLNFRAEHKKRRGKLSELVSIVCSHVAAYMQQSLKSLNCCSSRLAKNLDDADMFDYLPATSPTHSWSVINGGDGNEIVLTSSQWFQELGYVVTRANDSPVAISRSSSICGFLCVQNRYFRLILGFDRGERKCRTYRNSKSPK